jgi:hypothetical protein
MTYQHTLKSSRNVFSSVESLVLALPKQVYIHGIFKNYPRFYNIQKKESYGSQEGSSLNKHAYTYYPLVDPSFHGMA